MALPRSSDFRESIYGLSVTAIVPCYNSASYLAETLNSIIAQSYENLCIIAIDDGSSDDTRRILEKFRECGKIKLLWHEGNCNRGVAATMNLGVEAAESDLVAFLDHDDLWYPDKIKRQVEVFLQNPEVDLVYTNGDVIDEHGNRKYAILQPSHIETNLPERLLLDCYIKSCSMVMVTRSALMKVGCFKAHILTTDHDMWLRLQESTNLYYLEDRLMAYRVHSTQSSHKRRLWEDGFLILTDAMKRFPYTRSIRRKRLAVLHYRLAEHDLKNGKRFKTAGNLIMSCFYDPVRSVDYVMTSCRESMKRFLKKYRHAKVPHS
ncbi:glycosyltransferase [Geomonas oryzae]|uniref:glycosyltransferase n=1 Tax=Geomonas oryzae TaxID=2364273 RepID=UPI00100AA62F|nr:glycosyltransferase [Geomonas oryzae]